MERRSEHRMDLFPPGSVDELSGLANDASRGERRLYSQWIRGTKYGLWSRKAEVSTINSRVRTKDDGERQSKRRALY